MDAEERKRVGEANAKGGEGGFKVGDGVAEGGESIARGGNELAACGGGVAGERWDGASCLYLPAAKRRVMNWRTFGILVLASNWKAAVLLAAMTGSVAYQ